ncbi:MAG TPA: hypothetical protein DDY49_11380 [Paenibacillaceae bacterium]|nr:hypothetical protein [Paenibacillaceae bacterium]
MFNAGIIGFAFAYVFRSYFTYIGLFFYWILTSPYNSILLPVNISRWMNQGEQNPNLTYDDYHGLFFADAIFTRHLIIFFLSIALVSLALVIRQVKESTKKEKIILIITSVSTLFLSIILFPLSANSLMKDENASSEDIYYRQFQEQNPLNNTYNVSPTLQIKSYKIDLNTKNEKISYIAALSVNISKENYNKWSFFTLYHGLKVNSVHLDGNEMNWKQDGDIVSILCPEKSKGDLTFKVEGVTSSFNPVDKKSFYLSASFPWYPIPGKWRIAEINTDGNIRYNCVELQTPAYFHIKYHKKERIFSNLLNVSENEFKGEAKGVTLMKGNLLEFNEKGMHIVAPPDLITRVPILLPKMKESLDKISFSLKESNIKIPENIFVVPVEDGNNDVEIYSDQLVIDADQLRLFYGQEEKYFTSIDCLIPSFYLNRNNHLYDSESLFLALFDSLYSNSRESYNNKRLKGLIDYPESLRDKKARSIPSQIIALQNKISREKMQVLLLDWYNQLKVGKLSVEYMQTSLNNLK